MLLLLLDELFMNYLLMLQYFPDDFDYYCARPDIADTQSTTSLRSYCPGLHCH